MPGTGRFLNAAFPNLGIPEILPDAGWTKMVTMNSSNVISIFDVVTCGTFRFPTSK